MNERELVAAYIGVIRHELKLARGSDALLELELRLRPDDPKERPPSRAPGIARLTRALRRLRTRQAPKESLDEFAEDLRFLRVFEADTSAWTGDALRSLLGNVMSTPVARPRRRRPVCEDTPREPAPVVPLRPRKPQPPKGDA